MPIYRFRTYSRRKGISRKYMDISERNSYRACNAFLKARAINMNIIHLNIRTVGLDVNLNGKDAIQCDVILKCDYLGRQLMFKIEEVT